MTHLIDSAIFFKSHFEKKSITREELFGGSTELDVSVYVVGQVGLLQTLPAGTETGLQGDALHVL